jgi:hypothetical protein
MSTRRSAGSSGSWNPGLLPRGYLTITKRPLQVLAFLLPLIVAYELSLVLVLRGGQTVQAHRTLLQFFDSFGLGAVGGLYLGGLAIVIVLFVWHILNRDPWQVDVRMLGVMALEAASMTLPLLILAQLLARSGLVAGDAGMPAAAASIGELGPLGRIAISVGAGLYEELLFRMLLIAIVHALLVDVSKASQQTGTIVAIVVSAAVGALYVFRGFGIVVGVHALYDVITTLFLIDPQHI